jgi:hypothetical protein
MPTKKVVIGKRDLSLDARPDRLDLRDRAYLPPLGSLPTQWPPHEQVKKWLPAYAEQGLVLNQGSEGACTGFGLAAVINFLLFVRSNEAGAESSQKVSPAMLYQLARLYDEWPGDDYEGSSCRGALKGWHRHGVCREALWPYKLDKKGERVFVTPSEDPKKPDDPASNWDLDALSCTLGVYYRVDVRSVVDMQAAIRQNGAIYVSGTVHEGWSVDTISQLDDHADLPCIKPVLRPKQPGGHAFCLVGYNARGFVVQNSWGKDWGAHGFALLPYEDWVLHGTDAWVFTLGVPSVQTSAAAVKGASAAANRARSPRFLMPSSGSARNGSSQWPVGLIGADDGLSRRYKDARKSAPQPLDPDNAYRHTIVLDRGFPVRNDITAENAVTALDTAALQRPLDWLKANKSVKVMVYAHGGLNSESDSINRIRVMAPHALANGIYPLFITWRSGPLETLVDMVQELAAKLGVGDASAAPAKGWFDRLADVTDRMLEPVLRAPGGAMWGQMKLNAVRASEDSQGGVRLMVERLKKLQAQVPKLEVHVIGHSAGAIMVGAMLKQMQAHQLKAASVRLFAPACTTRFALDHFAPAVKKGVLAAKDFHIHVLSDQNELGDAVGPYRKSLLYLVSRAFEDAHKMPLLGMARCFDPKAADPKACDDLWARDHLKDVIEWQAFWNVSGGGTSNLDVLAARNVSNGAGTEPASHGCFDNAVDVIGKALGSIVNPSNPAKVRIDRLDY